MNDFKPRLGTHIPRFETYIPKRETHKPKRGTNPFRSAKIVYSLL